MNVCLLNDSFAPVIDGVVNVVMNYADHLMRDHEAQVIVGTPKYPDADYSAYPYHVVPYPSFDTSALVHGYRAGNPFKARAVAELADFAPDIIHTHCPATATVMARLLREQTGAPIILTYHTKYDIDIERAVKNKLAAKEGIRAMINSIAACDEVWVVSRGAGESLKALGFEGNYRVMSNGVDFEKGKADAKMVAEVTEGYDLPEGVPVFLFVGRIMTYKGLPMILDALKRVSEAGQDFRMVFVGKGPDRELLEQKAEALGLMGSGAGPGKCIFVGPVYDREKLRAWNTRADLFLFPSTYDTNGLVVREAAACGLASVLIEGSCAAEDVTHGRNGYTIEETPEAMAALLLELCKNLDQVHAAGEKAMDEIVLLWRDCVSRAYDRYQVVLAEKRVGILKKRKTMTSDRLLSLTARIMDEYEHSRRIRKEVFHDFKETAVGMMENMYEAGESVEKFWEKEAKAHRGIDFRRKR